MAKFGTFKYGTAKYGTGAGPTAPDNISYKGKPLGVIVRRQINKEIIYRHCQGVQYKYKYFIPNNPQTVAQQAWRATFSTGVVAAKALTDEQKQPYIEAAKRYPGQTWFTMFMREYLYKQ